MNLLLAQRLRLDAGIESPVIRLNDCKNAVAFDSVSADTVRVSEVAGNVLAKRLWRERE